MPFLTIERTGLEYEDIPPARAAVPSLVLLHEGLGSLGLWQDFPQALAAETGCRTIAYSRRGYGKSDRLAAPRGIDYMHREALDILPPLIDALAIENPILIGHSDGASIALILTGDGRRKIRGLVLMAPHVFVEAITIAGIEAAKRAYQTTNSKDRLARHHDHVDDAFWGWNNIWLSAEFRHWNVEQSLGSVGCPILMIQGADDEYGSLAQLQRIRAGVKSSQVSELILPGCRHAPHRDQPDATLRAINAFVARL